jgi:hypothetical protein
MMRAHPALLLCGVLLSGCTQATTPDPVESRTVEASRGPIHVEATLSPANPIAGEHITLLVQITATADVDVTVPLITPIEGMLGAFTVLDNVSTPDLPLPDGGRTFGQQFTLDTFETGELTIPPMSVHFTDHRGDVELSGDIAVPSMDIQVQSALAPGETELRDMHALHELPIAPVSPWWWLAVPGVLVLFFAVFAFTRRGAVQTAVELTAAERARRDLHQLETDDLLERGEHETYFARVADIVRTYLEGRFGLHAPRATTREFLRDAERNGALAAGHRAALGQLLQLADLVKFARHEPQGDAGLTALHTARTFVDETEPQPEALLEGGAA